jgi:hypothetical protein
MKVLRRREADSPRAAVRIALRLTLPADEVEEFEIS